MKIGIDEARMVLTCGNGTLMVTPFQFRLAHYLHSHPGFVRSRAQIIAQLQSYGDRDGDLRSIDKLVEHLRRQIAEAWGQGAAACIQTRRGFGYFWKDA